ncbi:hypothetical protein ABZ721_31145 [Streptomyces sp. NPDC006733]|uniref:hypothetical protein n=1 Tax=Streptomyces sp. NPDC006733 TaxID=3155460 RepID=UPI0033F36B93
MTTRIRINIPGSRPIPPLVMRTPVEDRAPVEPPAEADPARPASSWNAVPPPAPAAEPAPEPEPEPEAPAGGERTSDWFAPRKAAAPPPPAPGATPPPAANGSGPAGGQQAGAQQAAGQQASGQPAAGQPTAGPYLAPPMGTPLGGAGSVPVNRDDTPWPGTNPLAPQDPAFGDPSYADRNYSDPEFNGPPFGPDGAPGDRATPFPGYRPPAGDSPQGPAGPAGPTTGPVTGTARLPLASQAAPGAPGAAAAPPGAPAAPGSPGGRVSGDTLVSGIPTVPAGPRTPKPPAADENSYRFEADSAPAPKGRSKVLLAGGLLVFLVGVAYGAGLLMNHAEVPKGTTVLGVDIGGKSRDEAVKALDAKLGSRTTAPIKVKVGGKVLELKPSVAGLSIDNLATVRSVAHTDYNPVSVIGSLLGGARPAEPVMIEDDEKLKSALQNLSKQAGGGSGSEGMVKFVNGKAVAVPGTPRQAVDVDGSMKKITEAYRTRAETGRDQPVELNSTTVQPKVTQAQLDEAIAGFGKTAMAGTVTVKTDSTHKVPFGPNKSLPKFLTMVADADGKLQPTFDLAVLKGLYGKMYSGALVVRDNGTKTPVTPQDVADAMLPALKSSEQSKKTVVIPHLAK